MSVPGSGSNSPSRVLCVDDDPQPLSAMVRVLETRFAVVSASGGAHALRLAEAAVEPFAVVVTDQGMPDVDGLTLLRRLQDLSPETTRVMLTGRADLETAMRAINEGQVYKYLLKPVDPAELLRVVESGVALYEARSGQGALAPPDDDDAPTLADTTEERPRSGPAPAADGSGRRYHLRRRVGRGVFGEIFLADLVSTAGFRRTVALKVLNPLDRAAPDAERRMRDEARLLGRVRHPNIVEVYDLVRLGGRWTIVMEYVPGADLDQMVRALERVKERFPAPAAFEVGAAVCRGLQGAYEAPDGEGGTLKVLHRDIKPSNVRLTAGGVVKVLDFGVAWTEMEGREALSRSGGWIGTERYMAPERILMEGDRPAGDVYAATATVVELLLGHPLGRTPVLEDRHQAFVQDAVAVIAEELQGASPVVTTAAELLWSGLDARPERRPTARDLAKGFAAVALGLHGARLGKFAHAFVPRVAGILGDAGETVDQVFAEEDAAGLGATWVGHERPGP